MLVVTPLSSSKISFSGGIVRMHSRNSTRRWRLIAVSRSSAWSDFLSSADPAVPGSARPETGSPVRQLAPRSSGQARRGSHRDAARLRSGCAPQAPPSPAAPAAPAHVAAAEPAPNGRSTTAACESSAHTRSSPHSARPASAATLHLVRTPPVSGSAGHRKMLVPSSSCRRNLASSTLQQNYLPRV
jgi:hypothetical protein